MSVNIITRKPRAMTSVRARAVRVAGHQAENEFAELIGGTVYKRGSGRKKDVEWQGDLFSVKSGDLKWQIFLYGKKRLTEDIDFQGKDLLVACLNSFPNLRKDYIADKYQYKTRLRVAMTSLRNFLNQGNNKIIFFQKAFLNNGEVDYFVVKDGNIFRVYEGIEMVNVIDSATNIVLSKARRVGEIDGLKVVFKLADRDITIGEIETRTDSDIHYRQLKFWMHKNLTITLLKDKIPPEKQILPKVIAHGKAINRLKGLVS